MSKFSCMCLPVYGDPHLTTLPLPSVSTPSPHQHGDSTHRNLPPPDRLGYRGLALDWNAFLCTWWQCFDEENVFKTHLTPLTPIVCFHRNHLWLERWWAYMNRRSRQWPRTSGGSKISPRCWYQLTPTHDFAKFSQKLHVIERIWTGGGGVVPTLGSANAYL